MSESKGFLSRFKPMSPKLTRRYTPQKPNTTDDVSSTTNIKNDNTMVTQNEVEEKLKAMRQKRLSRLNIFVADQVKLSETRNHENDIEEAIVSIKNTDQLGTKVNTKTVPENNNDNESYKKTSSAKKFINKLSCVNYNFATSVDDLSIVGSTKMNRQSLPNSNDDGKQSKQKDEEVRSHNYKTNIDRPESVPKLPPRKRSVFEKDDKATSDNKFVSKPQHQSEEVSSKLDTAIINNDKYVHNTRSSSTTELIFGQNSEETGIKNQIQSRKDEPHPGSFTHSTFGKVESNSRDDTPPRPPKIFTYETSTEFESKTSKNNHHNDLVKKSYENVVITSSKSGTKSVTTEVDTSSAKVTKTQENSIKLYENVDINTVLVDKNPPTEILRSDKPRSPLPVPRKTTEDVKILKKFQANYLDLCQILQNDSKVDDDELEDFKMTLGDTTRILDDYKLKLNQLEAKPMLSDKLEVIRKKIEDIKGSLTTFKGLKRDVTYLDLSNRLSSYFFEIKNDSGRGAQVEEQKRVLLSEIDQCIRDLEIRVELNEKMLRQVLEELVMLIMTNRLIPTIV